MADVPADRDAATFRYFAYGSNMWPARIHARCPSARAVGIATLVGWRAVYDKPSLDGSAKLNIRRDPGATVTGVVYDIDAEDRPRLDAAEPGYQVIETSAGLAYAYLGQPATVPPFDWYVSLVEAGARVHGLTPPPAPAERA